jgi:antirestriction protein ArdC
MNVIYETVTNEIIAELEAGAIPWTKPWKSSGKSIGIMPTNAVTGRSYSGINIPILWHSASSCAECVNDIETPGVISLASKRG